MLIAVVLVLFLAFGFFLLNGPRIGNTFSTINNCLNCTAVPEGTAAFAPTSDLSPSQGEDPLEEVDEILRKSIPASLAYNAPDEMRLDETVTIELLLNPSLSEGELEKQITEAGDVVTSVVQISPQMKAEIFARDPDAFTIRNLHADSIQVVSGTETTRWSWYVTANKEGPQRLTIILYRLVEFEGEQFWREVQTYRSDIEIRVTLLNRLGSFGWGWIAGLLLLFIAVPALWRGYLAPRRSLRRRTSEPGPVMGAMDHIFISYRRSDSADITGRIYDRLIDEFGRPGIFKDVDSIPLGTDFKEYLDRKVSECNALLAIIGDDWLEAVDAAGNRRLEDPADFVRVEIESALARGIPVIPVLVRGAGMPSVQRLPPGLKKLVYRNGLAVRPDPDFHRDMDRLIAALKDYFR